MDFSWSKFWLPRPWSRGRVNREHQTEDGSPVFTPEASCPVLDLSHESQREDDCHERSPAERAAILQRMSEQLMLACAQECPELQEKIDVASAHLFAVTNELTERNQAGLQRQSRHVSIPLPEHLSQTDELLGAVAAEGDVHMEYVDPVHESVSSGYSLTEPDIGVFSVNTPFHDGIPSARFVHQSTTRANTCTTVTVTVGRPLMSSHLYSPTVSDVGTQMVEETSLHGRIWIPSSYSTPAVQKATGQYSNRIGPQNHVDREPDSQHWRLVSDDRPSNGGQQCVDQGERYGRVQFGTQYQWPTDQPHVPRQCHGVMQHDTVVGSRATPPNRPSLSYEAWVSEMEPLLRQAFEAGSLPLSWIPLFACLMACLNFLRLVCQCSPGKNSGEELQSGPPVKVKDQWGAWWCQLVRSPRRLLPLRPHRLWQHQGQQGQHRGQHWVHQEFRQTVKDMEPLEPLQSLNLWGWVQQQSRTMQLLQWALPSLGQRRLQSTMAKQAGLTTWSSST